MEQARAAARDRRTNRRLRSLLASSLVLLAGAGVAVGVAARQSVAANEERRTADAHRLAAVAAGVLDERPDLAALLSVEASRRSDDLDTRGALFASLTDQPGLRSYIHSSSSIVDVSIDQTGRWAAVPNDSNLELWNVSGRRPRAHGRHRPR